MKNIAMLLAAFTLCGCFRANVNVGVPSAPRGGPPPASHGGDEPSQLPQSSAGQSWGGWAMGVAGFSSGGRGPWIVGYDTLAYPQQATRLVARAGIGDSPAAGMKVELTQRGKRLAEAVTDRDGYAAFSFTPTKEGDYTFEVRLSDGPGEGPRTAACPLLLSARAKDTPTVVVDLEHTVVASGEWRTGFLGAKAEAGSADALTRLSKEYSVVYLASRGDLMGGDSKDWMRKGGYPLGPVLLGSPAETVSRGDKLTRAGAIRKSYPAARIAVTGKPSDAQAYTAAGMTAYVIVHPKDKPKDLRQLASQIRLLEGRSTQVVEDWFGVLTGVFDGKRFLPDAFAQRLERRAKELDKDRD